MLDTKEILKEIERQIANRERIEKITSKEGKKNETIKEAEEILSSTEGTPQRNTILNSSSSQELYNMYLQEISDTSNMIFREGSNDKAKILDALEYMRVTANKESEDIAGLETINISGINAAILGESTEKSQLAYYRDLLKNKDMNASIVKTKYKNSSGKKEVQELVEVKTEDGTSLLINPYEYNGTLESIEKYNNGDYKKQQTWIEGAKDWLKTLSGNRLPEGRNIFSQEEILESSQHINEQLIQKYKIREMSQVARIQNDTSIDNQLKIIGLVGENLTPIRGNEAELLRTIRMNDGKEIEASKLLELFYQANGLAYTKTCGNEKSDESFTFNEKGVPYTISPSNVYRNTQGDNIDKLSLFVTEDRDAFYRQMTYPGDTSKTIEECNANMEKKIKTSFLATKDISIVELQRKFEDNVDIATVQKQQDIKRFSIDDISFQLGIQDMLKKTGGIEELKAHCVIREYLNQNSYYIPSPDNKEIQYQYVGMSDSFGYYLPYIQELFFMQNGMDYEKDEDNNLILKIDGKDYKWENTFNPLLSVKTDDTLENQKLIQVDTQNVVNTSNLKEFIDASTDGVIPLSERIPTTSNEINEITQEIREKEESISKDSGIYDGPEYQQYLLESYMPGEDRKATYQEYMESKNGRKDFLEQDSNELAEQYEGKLKSVTNAIESVSKSDEEKILTAMEYVRLSGRYENNEDKDLFKIGSLLSQTGMTYALGGEGVCCSQAEYLKDILKEMGISAKSESCYTEGIENNIMRTEKSTHQIVRVELDGKTFVLDPTHYIGTKDSLAYTDIYTYSSKAQDARELEYSLLKQGASKEAIHTQISTLNEIGKKKSAIQAEMYPKMNPKMNPSMLQSMYVMTPFGKKPLKSLGFQTMETTDEKIIEARQKVGEMLCEELGINEISQFLEVDKKETDLEKQSAIMGYMEQHMLPKENEDIRHRVVGIGDNYLELTDAIELFYLSNNIPYQIKGEKIINSTKSPALSLNLNLDNENVSLSSIKAYKSDLKLEEERNRLFKKEDGSFLEMSTLIQKARTSISEKEEKSASFQERYKVDEKDFEKRTPKLLENNPTKFVDIEDAKGFNR